MMSVMHWGVRQSDSAPLFFPCQATVVKGSMLTIAAQVLGAYRGMLGVMHVYVVA